MSLAEREEISRALATGRSIRSIASQLGRAPSTVSREIHRNGGQGCYRAAQADQAAWDRALRPKTCKLVANRKLANLVAGKLQCQWSPQQIAGWLKHTYPCDENSQVSHETIYRSLFIQARGALKKELLQHLRRNASSTERRRQRSHPAYARPELLAIAPNQVWSWDITKLKGPAKWTCFHLYVILDIFSRYVVGWLIAPRESAELAQQLIADTVGRHDVMPGALTLHADRGTSMRSKSVASLLVDLDVAKSHSRPYTSDDNPYSESQFKTMKYRPDFPVRFGSIEDARSHCQTFFAWYNGQHCHSGIGHMTPHSVHYGQAQTVREVRQATLNAAFTATPNRFKGIRPCLKPMPTAAWINPPPEEKKTTETRQPCTVNL